jgi:hypothetical protein
MVFDAAAVGPIAFEFRRPGAANRSLFKLSNFFGGLKKIALHRSMMASIAQVAALSTSDVICEVF